VYICESGGTVYSVNMKQIVHVSDLTHDGSWNTFDENEMYSSCPRFPSRGHKNTPVKHKHISPPSLQLPTYNGRSAGIPRSWFLLSTTG